MAIFAGYSGIVSAMKNEYLKPFSDIVNVQSVRLVCTSGTGENYSDDKDFSGFNTWESQGGGL